MSLRFVIGASGAGKSTYLQKDMIEKSMAEPKKQFTFLVPDQFTMQVQKDIVCMHPNKGIMNIDVLSFGRLYYRVMEEVGKKEQILLDDTGKNLILRHLALDMEEQLPIIGRSMRKVGYIHEVKSVISEFMQYNISPKDVEKIMQTAKDKPVLRGKLADLKKLYEAFLQYLGDKYLTTEETMDQLAMALPSSKHFRGSAVVLDGFTGFTPVQNRVIRTLLQICEEVIVVMTKDGESDLFDLSRRTMASLEKMAKEENVTRGRDIVLGEKPVARLRKTRELAFLEENIFRNYGAVYEPDLPGSPSLEEKQAGTDSHKVTAGTKNIGLCGNAFDAADVGEKGMAEQTGTENEIGFFVADTPREEMRKVCLEIRKLIKEQQYSYRDIAVVCGDLEQYGIYGREMFSLYGIPAFVDNNHKLLLNPFTEFLKGGLQVILKDYSYESIMHFLKSGFTGISPEEIDLLENYLLALGIRGKNRWGRKFVRYPAYMKKDLDALEAVDAIRQKVLDILEPVRKIEKLATADAKTEAVYQFIVKNQMFERLEQQREEFAKRGDYAREKEYGQLYHYVMQLLEQMASLLRGEEVSLEEYIRILEAGLTELSIGVLPQGVDYVLLGDIERSRLGNIKALFFVGCNDGIIPKANAGGGIISDFDREYLLEEGYELSPSPRQKMQMQRLYLYMNMTKPKEHLYLSYARMDGEGKSLRPSYLIDLVKEMFPGKKTEDFSEAGTCDRICGTKDAEGYLAELLRLYADDMLPPDEEADFYALYHHLRSVDEELVNSLTDAAFYQYEPKRLGKAVCRQIYGAVLATSISKLEQFATCAYAHFLEYGMHLKENERYAFEAMDMGNIFHQVLQLFSLKLKEKQMDWRTFTEEDGRTLLREILQNVTADYRESVLYQNGETTYGIMRMQRILERTIFQLQYQIKKGGFAPDAVEVEFKNVISLKDWRIKTALDSEDTEDMEIRGKIDRLDTCRKGNKLYVKVVDYKSGEKKIDLLQLYQGTQLQLVIYLDQAVQKVKAKLPKSGEDSTLEVVPAAMFYYPVTDPMRDESTREAAEKDLDLWLRKKLRQSGLYQEDSEIIRMLDAGNEVTDAGRKDSLSYSSDVIYCERNKDGTLSKRGNDAISAADLSTVMGYANWKVAELGNAIRTGNKAIAPRSKENCSYCNFREICEFDMQTRGFRQPEEQKMNKEDVLAVMGEILEKNRSDGETMENKPEE
ncbi:MAG: PD-(D/E)XK nuclease family protein [Lachnospiraceae bacterium]